MTYEERCRRQQVIGIVNMVYDICEKYGEQPTPAGIVVAVVQWMDDGITPSEIVRIAKMEKQIVDPYNNCAMCDAQILRSQTYCNDCNGCMGDPDDEGETIK